MREPLIFWERGLRVTGPGAPADVAARLQSLLAATRFSLGERLVGRIDGARLRVWRKTPLAGHSDVVQFEGVIRPDDAGTAIEGTVRYKLATRIQFLGLLAIGVALAAIGVVRMLSLPDAGGDLAAFGLFMAILAAAWICAGHGMRGRQIEFIESKLAEAVGARVPAQE